MIETVIATSHSTLFTLPHAPKQFLKGSTSYERFFIS